MLPSENGANLQVPQRTFGSRDVFRITAVSRRQLQWWDEHRLVSARHDGRRRVYRPSDVLEILTVAELRRKGLSLQKIRRVVRSLRRELERLSSDALSRSSLYLLTDGLSAHLEERPDRAMAQLAAAPQLMAVVCLSEQMRRIAAYKDPRRQAKDQLDLF